MIEEFNRVDDKVLSGYLNTYILNCVKWPYDFIKNIKSDIPKNFTEDETQPLKCLLEELIGTFLVYGNISDLLWSEKRSFVGDNGIYLDNDRLMICQIILFIDSDDITEVKTNEDFRDKLFEKLKELKKNEKKNNKMFNKHIKSSLQMYIGNIETDINNKDEDSIDKTDVSSNLDSKEDEINDNPNNETFNEENKDVNNINNEYKYICILLSVGKGYNVIILRFKKNSKDAIDLLATLKGTIIFLNKLRALFKDFRAQVAIKDKICKEFIEFIRYKKESPVYPGKKIVTDFYNSLSPKAIRPLSVGLNEQYLSWLEEAISYCPITTFAFYKQILYLEKIDVNLPRRTWRAVNNLQSFYRFFKKIKDKPTEVERVYKKILSLNEKVFDTGNLLSELDSMNNNEKNMCTTNIDKNIMTTTEDEVNQTKTLSEKDMNEVYEQDLKKRKMQNNINYTKQNSLEKFGCEMIKIFKTYGGQCRIGKVHGRCEDATFQTDHPPAFGIFDGVGSWSLEGIDASKFSIGLALACQREAEKMSKNIDEYAKLPNNTIIKSKMLLKNSHESVKRDYIEAYGSSTAIVGIIDEYTGKCGIASLGDSVCMILRREFLPSKIDFDRETYPNFPFDSYFYKNEKGRNPSRIRKVIWKTKDQKWDNGAPYQLSNLPDKSQWKNLEKRGFESFVKILEKVDIDGDSPDMAISPDAEILCMPGDLILLMSDGVSDNLFDEEIEAYCTFAISPEEAYEIGCEDCFTPAQDIAHAIANIAKRRSEDVFHQAPFLPFSKETKKGNVCKGRKIDDISCVAVWVVCENIESVADFAFNPGNCSTLKTDKYYKNRAKELTYENYNDITPTKPFINEIDDNKLYNKNDKDEKNINKMFLFDNSETPIKFHPNKENEEERINENLLKDNQNSLKEENMKNIINEHFQEDFYNKTPDLMHIYKSQIDKDNIQQKFENMHINTPLISKDNKKNFLDSLEYETPVKTKNDTELSKTDKHLELLKPDTDTPIKNKFIQEENPLKIENKNIKITKRRLSHSSKCNSPSKLDMAKKRKK